MRHHVRFAALLGASLGPACVADPAELVIDDQPIGETVEYRADPGSVVRYRDLELVAPPQTGDGVGMAIDRSDGWLELELENTGDGLVSIRLGEPAASEPAAAALGECEDGAFRTHHRWGTRFDWYLNPAGIPAGFDAKAEAALVRAADNIVTTRNSCGLTDQVSATHRHRGRTTSALGISAAAGCQGRNNRNVLGWRVLPSSLNAVTCWYWGASQLLEEADIAFNLDRPWDTGTTVSSGCVDHAHLEGIATHELGHAFGLLHPTGSHPALTMDPVTPACTAVDRTLGRGDVLGLRSLY